ncbi:MAG: hypothetical protein BWZ10_01897 [candidate division BRC1 bacterium ADurb.BinA364]|nr:MAG: hypothetical protein BWZ10_01897 [candidate division BRC1 bacterium ADurb.BinA364]
MQILFAAKIVYSIAARFACQSQFAVLQAASRDEITRAVAPGQIARLRGAQRVVALRDRRLRIDAEANFAQMGQHRLRFAPLRLGQILRPAAEPRKPADALEPFAQLRARKGRLLEIDHVGAPGVESESFQQGRGEKNGILRRICANPAAQGAHRRIVAFGAQREMAGTAGQSEKRVQPSQGPCREQGQPGRGGESRQRSLAPRQPGRRLFRRRGSCECRAGARAPPIHRQTRQRRGQERQRRPEQQYAERGPSRFQAPPLAQVPRDGGRKPDRAFHRGPDHRQHSDAEKLKQRNERQGNPFDKNRSGRGGENRIAPQGAKRRQASPPGLPRQQPAQRQIAQKQCRSLPGPTQRRMMVRMAKAENIRHVGAGQAAAVRIGEVAARRLDQRIAARGQRGNRYPNPAAQARFGAASLEPSRRQGDGAEMRSKKQMRMARRPDEQPRPYRPILSQAGQRGDAQRHAQMAGLEVGAGRIMAAERNARGQDRQNAG